jgi:ABC-type multidrug transport system ATPase subunit
MLLTTYYDEVEYLCDRIGIMDGGKLIQLGTLAQAAATRSRVSDETNRRSLGIQVFLYSGRS